MLNVKPENLFDEVQEAVKFRKLHTDMAQPLVVAEAGNDWRQGWATDDLHENFVQEYIQTFLPQIIDGNPRMIVQSDSLDFEREQAMNAGITGWLDRSRFAEVMTPIAKDMLVWPFGMAMVTMETIPGYGNEEGDPDDQLDEESPWVWPRLHRISPVRVFADHHASDFYNSRFRGHHWIRDIEDLRTARDLNGKLVFDPEALLALGIDSGVEELRREQNLGYKPPEGPPRNQVVGYEVYVPETRMIYTLGHAVTTSAKSQEPVFLRKPRPYKGPRDGPYVMFGIHYVSDQLYPVSPIQIAAALGRELNAHRGQASDDAGVAKSLTFYDSGNNALGEALKSGPNGSLWGVPGFNGQATVVKVGGAQPETLDYITFLKAGLDRLQGMSEAIRGNVDPNATATAENIAKQSADVRTRFAQTMFQRGVLRLIRLVADQMHDREIVRFPVVIQGPDGHKQAMIFEGGSISPGISARDMTYRIAPYSMEVVDDAIKQRRMQSAVEVATQVAPLCLQLPYLKPRELLGDLFDSLNIPDAGDRYIDYEILDLMRGALFAQGGAGSEPGVEAGAPAGAEPSAGGGPGGANVNSQTSEMAAILAEQQNLAA